MLGVCKRWVGDGDRLLHIDPKFFRPYQHFFLVLVELLNRGSLRVQAVSLRADSHTGNLSPNWLQIQLELELELRLPRTDSSRLQHLVI